MLISAGFIVECDEQPISVVPGQIRTPDLPIS